MMAFSEILARRRVELPQEEMPDKGEVLALKSPSKRDVSPDGTII